jgi:hypothetical protein
MFGALSRHLRAKRPLISDPQCDTPVHTAQLFYADSALFCVTFGGHFAILLNI